MRRLLITGGSGYLGAEVTRLAVASGVWQVYATYHLRPFSVPGAEALALDIRNGEIVDALFARVRPAVVIHTAYVQHGPDLWAASAHGAGHVAQAASRGGARLIHLSSDAIFDGESDRPYSEADDPSPVTPYAEAKAAAERLVAAAAPDALIVRTSLIYGGATPGPHEQLALDAAAGRNEVTFFVDEIRCPVQVTDLAQALLELAPVERRGRLHLAGADAVSRYEFACLVVHAYGGDSTMLRSGRSADSGLRRPHNLVLDSGTAVQLLRTRLRGVREVLGYA